LSADRTDLVLVKDVSAALSNAFQRVGQLRVAKDLAIVGAARAIDGEGVAEPVKGVRVRAVARELPLDR